MPQLTIYSDGEETEALYVDGKLDRIGDGYWVQERANELAGIEVISDDAFWRGSNDRDKAAKTIDEIHAYAADRDSKLAQADELRRQAAELEAQAAAIRAGL